MTSNPLAAADEIDHALATLIADGAAAARLALAVLKAAPASAGRRALAHAVLAMHAFREGPLGEGLKELALAEPLIDASADGTRAAQLLLHARALWHRREGSPEASETLLRPLHALVDQRSPIDAYLSTAALGVTVSLRGDDFSALDLFYQALALARRSGEDSLLVNALNNLGSHQSDLHNLEDAVPMLQECLAGAMRLGSRRQIVYAAGNLVQCLCLMGEPAQALAIAREHLIGKIHADDPPALHRDEEIAQALLDNGLIDEAEAALGGEVHIDPMSNELATTRVYLLARLQLARGQADRALQLCLARQQLLQGEASTMAIDRVSLARVAAQSAHAVGNHELAYQLLEQAFATHEQLLGRAARSRQLSLQISHRLRQAEWERDAAQQMATRLEELNASLQAQMAETQRLQQRLRAQALEDPLTGLHNRRHLMEAGAALLALLHRRQQPLAVVLVDLDHFKRVNDEHGHEAGDRVLKTFADLARRAMRADDIVCRYGGEEFALLIPGASAALAATMLTQLLQQFSAVGFDDGAGGSFSCSFSAGVAATGTADDALPALLARADAALYVAKGAGRARVALSPTAAT